ncbi:hypothetical protein E4A48_08105 [Xanthomonas cerealis pv. cerealis]|uniref:Uncharacterized protein n=1 Tax=Xanthomonas cerealis pv. cerealis TaxID=152263 RepID=A0A514EIJ9_9XANT|nr:hypothetical protein E4A48_08105 [Xanthomonas translucens pv. cerealis]UKE48982.1 hypothetical protein KHA79_09035 [Xanthomonas translucens pv. cerealis]
MALLLAVATGASAAPTASKPDVSSYQGGLNPGAPYIEQVGSECVMVNVYLEQRDGVAQQVILREPVECSSGNQAQDLAVAHMSN